MAYQLNNRDSELDHEFLVVMEGAARTYSKLRHPFNQREIPLTGNYRVRVRAVADSVLAASRFTWTSPTARPAARPDFASMPRSSPAIYEFEKTFDAFEPGEFQVGIVNGTRFRLGNAEWYHLNGELTRLAEAGQAREATRHKARLRAEGAYDHDVRSSYVPEVLHIESLPKLYLDWIEIVGPLHGDYPPPSLTTIFGDYDAAGQFAAMNKREDILAETRTIFQRLLPRAFRRPVTDAEIVSAGGSRRRGTRCRRRFAAGTQIGPGGHARAPDFLFLFEPSDSDASSPRRLKDHELATRLSYFLWSSLPDAELSRLAGENRLHEPATLSQQIDRMLDDPQCEGFVQGFARQWLKIDEIGRFAPISRFIPTTTPPIWPASSRM